MTEEVTQTIEMKAEDADKWLSALRSGKYKQGDSVLSQYKQDWATGKMCTTYCCLGVLEHALAGEVENNELPSNEWLTNHNIKFQGASAAPDAESDVSLLPPVEKYDGKFNQVYHSIAGVNDSGDFSFEEIANILEKRIKRV